MESSLAEDTMADIKLTKPENEEESSIPLTKVGDSSGMVKTKQAVKCSDCESGLIFEDENGV